MGNYILLGLVYLGYNLIIKLVSAVNTRQKSELFLPAKVKGGHYCPTGRGREEWREVEIEGSVMAKVVAVVDSCL